MKMLIPMDSAGRVVIPKSIRQSLNAPPDAMFELELLGGRLELTLTGAPPAKLRRKGKLLVVPKQGNEVDAVQAVDQTRASRV